MRSAEITIAEKTYTIDELASRKAAAWRGLLQERLGDVALLIESAPDTDISSGLAIANLIRQVGTVVIGSPDTLKEMLFAYSPALQAKLEASDDDYFDSELIAAFVEVVKLAYPFGQLAGLLASFASGAASK